jgi:hypothetical protein
LSTGSVAAGGGVEPGRAGKSLKSKGVRSPPAGLGLGGSRVTGAEGGVLATGAGAFMPGGGFDTLGNFCMLCPYCMFDGFIPGPSAKW